MRQPPTDEEINASIEAGLRSIAASIGWPALIADAMACNPEPLKAGLIQVGGRKDLCPPEMQEFLTLMEEYKPRQGRPKKDGKDALRAASKAWHRALLCDSYYALANLLSRAEKYDSKPLQRMKVTPKPYSINVQFKKEGEGRKLVRLHGTGTPSELALQTMADALFGVSAESIRNEIYPRKKTTKKGTTKTAK